LLGAPCRGGSSRENKSIRELWIGIMAPMRLLIASLMLLLPLWAQETPKQGGKGPQPPKNLKILKPEEVRPMMGAFRTALGVQCTHCHVMGAFDSDENPKKNVARTMISMVREINSRFPGEAKERVTCYTCHRGKVTPETAPPPAAPPAQ
jgi:hypothetical protein